MHADDDVTVELVYSGIISAVVVQSEERCTLVKILLLLSWSRHRNVVGIDSQNRLRTDIGNLWIVEPDPADKSQK